MDDEAYLSPLCSAEFNNDIYILVFHALKTPFVDKSWCFLILIFTGEILNKNSPTCPRWAGK
jgi:hypothetical protein